MTSSLPGPPPSSDRAYWHPERKQGRRPRLARWVPCTATGAALAAPQFDRTQAEAWDDVALVLDRRTGIYFDPYTREQKHNP